jgi:thiol-disulfide isomerase/thioredoxin
VIRRGPIAFSACLALGIAVVEGSRAYGDQPTPETRGEKSKSIAVCQDSDGGVYSQGAVLSVRGQLMQCVVGPHWAPMGSEVSTSSALDVEGERISDSQEAAILKALGGSALPALECGAVLNSAREPAQLLRVAPGNKVLVLFWTPTCGPCKPLLAELATLAGKPRDLTFVGVVQAADPELEPPGDWQLLRVKEIMTQYKVSFPTCVHTSTELSRRWQAGGVPLTLLVSEKGVERVALGGKSGHELLESLSASSDAR